MSSVAEVVEKIEKSAEVPNREVRDVRGKMVRGAVVRQGDVYFLACDGRLFNKRQPRADQDRNLAKAAEGTSGHAHTLVGDAVLFDAIALDKLTQGTNGDPLGQGVLLGPAFRAQEDVRVTHEEHSEVILPAGYYQVLFQLDPIRAQRSAD